MSLLSSLRHTVVLSAIFLGFGAIQQARAATFIVTSTDDSDGSICGPDCTLRQAINAANKDPDDSDVITFDETVFASRQTLELTYHNSGAPDVGLPNISSSVSIIGPTTPESGLTISANKSSNAMSVYSQPDHVSTVTIANLHITDAGTGLLNQGGDVTIKNCTFSDNVVGIENRNVEWMYCGVNTEKLYERIIPVLKINNCTFARNSKFGINHHDGTILVDSCTVNGSDIGVNCWKGVVTVFNSLIVGNTSFNLCDYQEGDCLVTKIGQNITMGTPEEAGLDPRGLRDNGGPTPTIALVKGGAAVDAGTADVLTDQRGKPRQQGEHTDIGAFEYDDKPSVPSSK